MLWKRPLERYQGVPLGGRYAGWEMFFAARAQRGGNQIQKQQRPGWGIPCAAGRIVLYCLWTRKYYETKDKTLWN